MKADQLIAKPHDGSHLTDRQARVIERYIHRLQAELNLSQWRIWLARDLPPDGATAMIEPSDGRYVAMLYLEEGWWARSAEDKRLDLTHEVLHLAHYEPDFLVRTEVAEEWPLYNLFAHSLERMVDGLALALAPKMPEWRP